jgi:hypothetical protein
MQIFRMLPWMTHPFSQMALLEIHKPGCRENDPRCRPSEVAPDEEGYSLTFQHLHC